MSGPPEPEGKLLSEALSTVKIESVQMKRCLDGELLMDALKSASTMLAELRTSSLSPKQYYELYMAVFDALRHLSTYLNEAHLSGKHHLADLYEIVQYAGNILVRLYLMITVGSVYMSIPDAPVKEIMKDMMEMTRGVQHPTRGLFLRHYLSGQTRDCLPVGEDQGPAGNLQDSIGFVLTNFIEMNKLWVRLQHSGHSREREKREMERKELRILVGTNLVRLSQLEGVDLEMYQKTILPSILEQVVNCKDVIAQEYLMEVVIQVFTDEFHLFTLSPFLSATAQLHPRVNIKQIVIALIDRLASYAAREAENESPEEKKKGEEEAAKRLAASVKARKGKDVVHSPTKPQQADADAWNSTTEKEGEGEEKSIPTPPASATDGVVEKAEDQQEGGEVETKKFRGIPENVKLFEVFWHQVVELIKARPDLSIQDITALLVSLINLSLSCYPDQLEYVDQVLAFAKEKVQEFAESPDLHTPATTANLLSLLLSPINSYTTVLTLLALPSYIPLLNSQPFSTRRSIAHAIVSSVLKNETLIDSPEDVSGVLGMCSVLIKDQKDPSGGSVGGGSGAGGSGSYGVGGRRGGSGGGVYDAEEMAEEQGWVARMVHLFRSDDLEVQFQLLQTARKHFSDGGDRIRYTFPPLITSSIKLASRYRAVEEEQDDAWEAKLATIFKFIHQIISILYHRVESSETCLRLFLLAAQIADEAGLEELAYEFYVQAFVIYEESISESRAQLQAITIIIRTLQRARVFGSDNYDTLITKAALHGNRLLKKPMQANAVLYASHLWWQDEVPGRNGRKDNEVFRDPKRVLECLQKSIKIAGSCIEEIMTVHLYCLALDQFLYYFEQGVETVTVRFVNSLIGVITSEIDSIHGTDMHPSSSASPGLVDGVHSPEMIVRHFRNTLVYIQSRKAAYAAQENVNGDESGEDAPKQVSWDAVDLAGAVLKMGLGQ
ncbi:vacuolar protein sorting-associated protein 35 [Mrakia frigida]|uniref:retromer subunit VPS35 n=1 Tax=Mrakia frigida TaxID=29902 RepID=UPI003FCBF61C